VASYILTRNWPTRAQLTCPHPPYPPPKVSTLIAIGMMGLRTDPAAVAALIGVSVIFYMLAQQFQAFAAIITPNQVGIGGRLRLLVYIECGHNRVWQQHCVNLFYASGLPTDPDRPQPTPTEPNRTQPKRRKPPFVSASGSRRPTC
jgi:hypothetical protein